MSNAQVIELYFNWLLNLVCTHREKQDYEDLMRLLFRVDFRYSIRRDENRAADGVDLRSMFADEYEIDYETRHEAISGPCSVLEMMVALSRRATYSMLDGELDTEDDEMHYIFWLMMENIGLVGLKNGDFSHSRAMRCIDVLLDRKYAYNGENGGLFVVKKPRRDLRKVEIWYQMCWYFSEKLKFEEE